MANKMSTYQTQLKQKKKRKHGINKNKETESETEEVIRFDLTMIFLSNKISNKYLDIWFILPMNEYLLAF